MRIRNLLFSRFARNVYTLTLGAIVAQAITFVFMPFLTRTYSPADFGMLSLYVTIASFLAVLATARYDIAVLLPPNDSKARDLLQLSFLINFFFVAFILLVFTLSANPLSLIFNQPGMAPWFYFIAASIFLIAAAQILSNWFVRTRNYKVLSTARVIESLATGSVSLVSRPFGAMGLMIGYIAGQLVTPALLMYHYVSQKHGGAIALHRLQAVAREYKDFPKVNIIQSLMDLFQFLGIVFFASYFFSPEVVGYYALCLRVLQVPMWLIVKPIAQVFYSDASKAVHEYGDLTQLTRRTALHTAVIAFPVVIIVVIFGPYLFGWVFGDEWRVAGEYAQILVPWFYFDFIRSPISQVAIVLRKQSRMLLLSLIGNLILIASMVYAGVVSENIKHGFAVLAGMQSLYLLYVIFWLIKITKDYAKKNQ